MENKMYEGVLAGKLILLNAPPRGGKDTVANEMVEMTGCHKAQFKDHLYVLTAAVFNIPLDRLLELATDTVLKELPTPELDGHSPRNALILVSEVMIKPVMGKDYFGRVEKEKLPSRIGEGIVYSDSGFLEEALPLIEEVGPENTFVVKFTRKGAEVFSGDSRGWLPDIEGVKVLVTTNNGTPQELALRIINLVKRTRVDGE